MKTFARAGMVAVTLFFTVSTVTARDWYVSAAGTGEGLNSGSPTQNLAAVLNATTAGDAIYLNGGDGFGFAANSLTVRVQLTVQSYGTGQGIVSNTSIAATSQLLLLRASGVTLDNIELRFNDLNTGQANYRTLYLDSLVSNITIRNCTFRHFDSPGGNYEKNWFISMHASAHTNVTIVNNLFRDLRYGAGSYEYRHTMILAIGCVPLRLIGNTVSNYEGFVTFAGDPLNRDVQVLSNRLYRCYGEFALNSLNNVCGGLFKHSYHGLGGLTNEFAYNIIFNGFPDMTNGTRFAVADIDRGFNNGYVHNNTFYGLGVAALNVGAIESAANLRWYNNMLVTLNANTRTCFWANSGAIYSGLVYSNIWSTKFALLTNAFYGTNSVSIAGNPQMDPGFASLDIANAEFLRPTDPIASCGLGGTYIGAVNPATTDPFVAITNVNGSINVGNEISSYIIAGTNNEYSLFRDFRGNIHGIVRPGYKSRAPA